MKECMETDKKIQILLSTYNGEKYLREQLDSFLKLVGSENIKILVRDDGSTDSTLGILDEYSKEYGFKIVKGKNIGVNASLYELFNDCDMSCDYFAISDQDDVWLPYKFELALRYLNNFGEDKPGLFASCSQIVDEKLNPLGKTLVPRKALTFYNAMVQNVMPGHTQVFNRALMKEIIGRFDPNIHVVDWWIYLIASALGQIAFDETVTVLHRQHHRNAVGYELNWLKKALHRLKTVHGDKANAISRQLNAFFVKYCNELTDEHRREVQRYFHHQKDILSRLKFAFTSRVYRQTGFETLLFKILYVVGKYKL